MFDQRPDTRRDYLFLTNSVSAEAARAAAQYLRENKIRVRERHNDCALVGNADVEQAESARKSGLFLQVTSRAIERELLGKLGKEQRDIGKLWSYRHGNAFRKIRATAKNVGVSWGRKGLHAGGPPTRLAPEVFKRSLLDFMGLDEDQFRKKYRDKKPKYDLRKAKDFIRFERKIRKIHDDDFIFHDLPRIGWHLDPIFQDVLLDLPPGFIDAFFREPACWEMKGDNSVGVIFVESARDGGPVFSEANRDFLRASISHGLSVYLAEAAPAHADLSWIFDWHTVNIDVANSTANPEDIDEAYWRDPAMALLEYAGNTYSPSWDSIGDYRDDMRANHWSKHALVIFITPYANSWHGYASAGRITLAEKDDWGGWGINCVEEIAIHEVCHLFGSEDEYRGEGTPCQNCTDFFGCDHIPNGNCAACADPLQNCIMDANDLRLCPYTRGQIGWSDIFVELRTASDNLAGTNDDVWLDIGDRTFPLETPEHNDREAGRIDGYPVVAPGVTKEDIKRVGIRKESDGVYGGWKLERIRLWCEGDLICDEQVNQWLEDNYRWWASLNCGTSDTIVNRLEIKVTTADVGQAGTNDDVQIGLAGRSWTLDNAGANDFERGNTDSFLLDPGTGLYISMLRTIHIHKSSDGASGGWKLQGLEILTNGVRIYNNQSINKWLEDDDRDWYGEI